MLPLTKEKLKSNRDAKICSKNKNYQKVRDQFHYTCKHRGTAHVICNLNFNVPNKYRQYFIKVQTMIIIFL